MNLTIGMTIGKMPQCKSAIVVQQNSQKQAYSNNFFNEFSRGTSTAIKNNSLSLLNPNTSPSFKGSTTAGTPA